MPNPLVTEELLDAIAQVESGNNPKARGDLGLRHPAMGAFQMRQPAYQDVQRFYPQEFGQVPFERAMAQPTLQRQAARRYLEALQQRYGLKGLEAVIAGYNAGPSVRTKGIRNPDYVRKVKQRLGNATLQQFQPAKD